MMNGMLRGVVMLILTLSGALAQAEDVALVGILGSKALMVIDGAPPRTLAPGQSVGEVRLLSVSGDTAEVEIRGQKARLRMGDQPTSVGERVSAARQVTLVADVKGHFSGVGSINGVSVNYLVDTGASSVAMGASIAASAGIDFRKGDPGMASTANGVVPMWRVRIRSVRIGEIVLNDVEGAVLQVDMPYVLLGMSFLNRMEMRRDGQTMLLKQRY